MRMALRQEPLCFTYMHVFEKYRLISLVLDKSRFSTKTSWQKLLSAFDVNELKPSYN